MAPPQPDSGRLVNPISPRERGGGDYAPHGFSGIPTALLHNIRSDLGFNFLDDAYVLGSILHSVIQKDRISSS